MDKDPGIETLDEQILDELHFTTTPEDIARVTGHPIEVILDRLTVLTAEGWARYDDQMPGCVVATKAGLLRLHGRTSG